MSGSVEINSVESEAVTTAALPKTARREAAYMMTRTIAVALALMFVLGFALRLTGLSALGLAEDEINKLEAVRAYEHGDITPNAEHPMLMKALVFVSLKTAQGWNARWPQSSISDEAALRFPNILFGALTILPLFLLTAALFNRRTGLAAAALWAFGVNAITYNRIAKEDTLLVFFMLFAFYFYLRAKQASGFDAKTKRRNFALSGVSFGLMLASKYFPHYFGLNALYHYLYRVRVREPGEPAWKTPRLFYALIVIVFLLANPAVLLPQTWSYLQAYSSEGLLKHTGYLIGDTLYKNNVSATPFGTPLYFYLLFLAIKVPLPVIIAFVVGLVACIRRWRQPGPGFLLLMFVLWIVPYSLFGAKWLRYTLSLMPFVYMIAAVGIMALCRWLVSVFESRGGARRVSILADALLLVFFIALPAWSAYASRPHYALYTNTIGQYIAGFHNPGYFFPHDEFYDDGLREAIRFVCETAPQGATIVHETPGVARYYLQKFGRSDLQSRVLSDPQFNINPEQETFIILQRGRTYFENRAKMNEVRTRFHLVYAACPFLADPAAEVYSTRSGGELIKMCDRINL